MAAASTTGNLLRQLQERITNYITQTEPLSDEFINEELASFGLHFNNSIEARLQWFTLMSRLQIDLSRYLTSPPIVSTSTERNPEITDVLAHMTMAINLLSTNFDPDTKMTEDEKKMAPDAIINPSTTTITATDPIELFMSSSDELVASLEQTQTGREMLGYMLSGGASDDDDDDGNMISQFWRSSAGQHMRERITQALAQPLATIPEEQKEAP